MRLSVAAWSRNEAECSNSSLVSPSQHTHLLSAEECIMAADFQNTHPNPCRLAKSKYFGSKFVTVCVSGNESKQVDLSGYQVSSPEGRGRGQVLREGGRVQVRTTESKPAPVCCSCIVCEPSCVQWCQLLCPSQVSNQCMALVRDDCLVPTVDAPELGYIRESTSEQYVPDVFYKVSVLFLPLV